MSDAQFAALVSAIITVGGAFVGVARWAVGRFTASFDRMLAAVDRNTTAFTEMKERAAEQAEVLRGVAVDMTAVSDWFASHSGVTTLPDGIKPKKKKAQTPAGGTYHLQRPRTNVDE